jgi:hypothetical protein
VFALGRTIFRIFNCKKIKNMIEFTLSEESLPFDFFDEIGFSIKDLAIEGIKRKYSALPYAKCEIIFEKNYDLFFEKFYELRDSEAISDYCMGVEEIDESTGTWGYLHFEVDNIINARMKLEKESKILLEEVLSGIQF